MVVCGIQSPPGHFSIQTWDGRENMTDWRQGLFPPLPCTWMEQRAGDDIAWNLQRASSNGILKHLLLHRVHHS